MNSSTFLKAAGWILLILGILGFLLPGGVLIPSYLVFDGAENWAHTALGVFALLVGYVASMGAHKPVAILFGLSALVVGVWGFFVTGNPEPNWLGLTNFENPVDNVVHVVVGLWGLWAGFSKSV